MTAEQVHSELVKENILPLKIENKEDAVKAASAELIESLTIGVAQEAGGFCDQFFGGPTIHFSIDPT